MEGIFIPLFTILVMTLVIWKAGEGFESASDYLGRNLSNGVKGATINAIGSSLPELLTTLFFLFILRSAEGFAAGLGTTAGSAAFNVAVIPFVIGLVVYVKFNKTEVPISRKVILRDGIALILVNILLLVMTKSGGVMDGDVFKATLTWREGLYLMVFYLLYLAYLFIKMDKKEKEVKGSKFYNNSKVPGRKKREIFASILKFRFEQAFVGNGTITTTRAWLLLIFSMTIMSGGCYGLAEASIHLGAALDIPIFIVSVIIAAAATSVPDTFLSYKDALKGNYDDSISNAFGSNVFDIGFAVGFPVLLYGLVYNDIVLDKVVYEQVSELLVLSLMLTVIVFVLFIVRDKLTIQKLSFVFLLYFVFIIAVWGMSGKSEFFNEFSHLLLEISDWFMIT